MENNKGAMRKLKGSSRKAKRKKNKKVYFVIEATNSGALDRTYEPLFRAVKETLWDHHIDVKRIQGVKETDLFEAVTTILSRGANKSTLIFRDMEKVEISGVCLRAG